MAPKEGPLPDVLTKKNLFLSVLQMVNRYYQQHPESYVAEGLEEAKGPQNFVDRTNNSRLHYYGSKGWYKWYRKAEFENQMKRMFTTEFTVRKLELFGFKPLTDKISSEKFELLLKLTHEALQQNMVQNKIEQKLVPYSGPQCHEDRVNNKRMHYNVDFRFTHGTGIKLPNQPNIADTVETTTQAPSIETHIALSDSLPTNLKQYAECNFRVCSQCHKTRLLDERASKCFPLGSYVYAKKTIRPFFHCDMLVDITCDTEEDIALLPLPDVIPSYWLIVEMSTTSSAPTCALLVQNDGIYDNTTNSNILNTKIIQKFCYKDHKFSNMDQKLLVDWNSTGQTHIGVSGRRGYTPTHKNLKACKFTVPEGREAKCCQPWFDPVTDINDSKEILGTKKLNIIKILHSIVNALKIIRCVKCKRQTPGFDVAYAFGARLKSVRGSPSS